MSLNKIIIKIREWNDSKNKRDIEHTSSSEALFYEKDSDVKQVINDVSFGKHGNGMNY